MREKQYNSARPWKKLKGCRLEYTYSYEVSEEERNTAWIREIWEGKMVLWGLSVLPMEAKSSKSLQNTCNIQAHFPYPRLSGIELKERECRVEREWTASTQQAGAITFATLEGRASLPKKEAQEVGQVLKWKHATLKMLWGQLSPS